MQPSTYGVLKNHKILTTQNQAARTLEELLARNVSDFDEVDDGAMITDEIRTALCGHDGETDPDVVTELNELFGELTRPNGPVNQLLDGNGHCLCSASVPRLTTTAEGVTIVVRKQGRFVTDNADIAAEYRIAPMVGRLERSMERVSSTISSDVRRLKGLEKHVPGMIRGVHDVLNRELPAPKKNGGSS